MPIQFKSFKIDGSQGGGGFSVGKLKTDILPSPTATPAPTGTPTPSATVAGATPTPMPTNFLALYTWGDNSAGYLARDAFFTGIDDKPKYPPYSGAWTMFAQSTVSQNAFGLKKDGTLWVWGLNTNGQLGQNNTTHRTSPLQVAGSYKYVSGNIGTISAIKTDGSIWSWGSALRGQLGDNSTANKSSPVQWAHSAGTSWTMVSVGTLFQTAIKSDGTLWAVGDNQSGLLGQNDTVHRSSPVQIGNDTNWAKVVSGRSHWLALKTDGTLWACGNHGSGQLGTGSLAILNRSSPVQVGTANDWADIFVSLMSGDNCAGVKTDGRLFGWGQRNENNFGDGYYNNSSVYLSTPVQIGTDTDWKKIGWYYKGATGFSSPNRITGFKLSTSGRLYVWGRNSWGLHGQGIDSQDESAVVSSPIQTFYADRDWADFYVCDRMILGLRASATDPLPTPAPSIPPTPTPAPTGAIYAWGYQVNGYNDYVSVESAVQVGATTDWIYVADTGNAAIDSSNKLWFYGYHDGPDVGKGAGLSSGWISSPVQSNVNTGVWKKVLNDGFTTFALRTDGTLWATGNNTYNLMNKPSSAYSLFTQVTTNTYYDFDTNFATVLAIRTDGSLWSWGESSAGERGVQPIFAGFVSSPVVVGGAAFDKWIEVSISSNHNGGIGNSPPVIALRTDKTAWMWGGVIWNATQNYWNNVASPVQFMSGTFKQVKAQAGGRVGLRSDGTVWAYGVNYNGRFGSERVLDLSASPLQYIESPIQVSSFNDVVEVALSTYNLLMRRSNGEVWGLGLNAIYDSSSQLTSSRFMVENGLANYSSPVQLSLGGYNWLDINAKTPIYIAADVWTARR